MIECTRCHGKHYSKPLKCGHKFCPIYSKISLFKNNKLEKQEFVSNSKSVFVGRYGYPNVNVGVLAPPEKNEEAHVYDDPRYWAEKNFNIQEVVDFRSNLVNSREKSPIKVPRKHVEVAQELSMSLKPVDLEVHLTKKPKYQMKFNDITNPVGPTAPLKSVDITENPFIPKKIDKVVSDTDMKSIEGLKYLFDKGLDENFLSNLLSIGNMGVGKNRKLVPTRWSITATDDTIGKQMIKEIKDYRETDYQLYFGSYLGNNYLVMFFPDVWSYELFEMYLPTNFLNLSNEIKYSTDHEFYNGRKSYAFETAGGYYACRLPILQKLKNMKRQSSVLVLRFITEEYTTPLGVWVVRESVRKAMISECVKFNSREEMISYASNFVRNRFNFDISYVLKNSKLLNLIKTQKKLFEF